MRIASQDFKERKQNYAKIEKNLIISTKKRKKKQVSFSTFLASILMC